VQVTASKTQVGVDTVSAVGVYIVTIVTQLVGNVQCDQQAGSKAYGQTKNIDSAVTFIFPKVTKCYLEIIFNHGYTLIIKNR
jgi:hypothetical protein